MNKSAGEKGNLSNAGIQMTVMDKCCKTSDKTQISMLCRVQLMQRTYLNIFVCDLHKRVFVY